MFRFFDIVFGEWHRDFPGLSLRDPVRENVRESPCAIPK